MEIKDTPMERLCIAQLTTSQLESLLQEIRERRLKPITVFLETMEMKKTQKDKAISHRLNKHIEMFEKEFEREKTLLAKLEKRAMEIRACRLELELEDLENG